VLGADLFFDLLFLVTAENPNLKLTNIQFLKIYDPTWKLKLYLVFLTILKPKGQGHCQEIIAETEKVVSIV
jgi:hypothetical protein